MQKLNNAKQATMLWTSQFKRDVPRGKQIIPTKMDLKTKYNASGEIIKLKARLVALGNKEWENFEQDYYSPTVAQKTINLIPALATYHEMHLYGIDIYGAFITADIDDGSRIYPTPTWNSASDG
jgi:hypothetical protein